MKKNKSSRAQSTAALTGILLLGLSACQHHQYQTFPKKDVQPSDPIKMQTTAVENQRPTLTLEEAIGAYQKEIARTHAVLNRVAIAQGEQAEAIETDESDQVLSLAVLERTLNDDSEVQLSVIESINEPQPAATHEFSEQPSLENIPHSLLKALLILKKTREFVGLASAPVETDLEYGNLEEPLSEDVEQTLAESPVSSHLSELVAYMQEYDIELLSEVQSNFYLKQLDAFKALKQGVSLISPEETMLNAEERELVSSLGISTSDSGELAQDAGESIEGVATKDAKIDMTAFVNDDEKLAKAQKLGKQGKLSDAIDILSSIEAESALFDPAQALLKSFSDKGVQDLRRRAAQAFQSALPLTKTLDQLEYFKTAKNYLEEAKIKFPDSTQISIVDNNLKMINRKIEQSQTESEEPK